MVLKINLFFNINLLNGVFFFKLKPCKVIILKQIVLEVVQQGQRLLRMRVRATICVIIPNGYERFLRGNVMSYPVFLQHPMYAAEGATESGIRRRHLKGASEGAPEGDPRRGPQKGATLGIHPPMNICLKMCYFESVTALLPYSLSVQIRVSYSPDQEAAPASDAKIGGLETETTTLRVHDMLPIFQCAGYFTSLGIDTR